MTDDPPSRSELAERPRLDFRAWGHPQPAGSKRAFPIRAGGKLTGRVAVTDDNPRAKSWQAVVADAAVDAMWSLHGPDWDGELMDGPLAMLAVFTVARPRGHFGSGRNSALLKPSAPKYPVVKPDCTKLLRAVEDALTGVVWRDDAQVVEQSVVKAYGSPEGVRVVVWHV